MSDQTKRTSVRFPIKMKVKIQSEHFGTRKMVTENFSDGGIFVCDPEIAQLELGEKITVQSDEGIEGAPVLNARIAWTNKKGAGIEYILDKNKA